MKPLITTLFLFLHSSECLFQGSEEVVDVLRADAEAYGGVRGRKTKVGRKLLRFPPTRISIYYKAKRLRQF